ncbi:Ig-like domain-containing protein, partial [Enterobacter cloacae]
DPAGNAGEKTGPVGVEYDITPPEAPGAISIADGNGQDLSSGGITNTNPLTLSGKGEAGDTVLIYDGIRLAGSTVVGEDGQWSAEINLPVEGNHDLQVGFRDPAGNAGGKTGPVGVEYDITKPDAPVPEAVENSSGKDLILSGLSNDGQMSMSGNGGDAGDLVKLYDGNALIGTAVVKGDGSWEVSGELAGGDGRHNLTASFTDPAGNESKLSAPVSVELDTFAEVPSFTLTDNKPTLTGGAGSVESGALVTIFNGTTAVASFSANANGSWEWAPSAVLADGTYQFNATQKDAAGNISATSASIGFNVVTSVSDFNDSTGQGWTFSSQWDGIGSFDGERVQLSGGRFAGHSTSGDIMSRSYHVEAGHTYDFSVRSVVWATVGASLENPSHYLTITVNGVAVVDGVQVINGTYGGSWTANITGDVVITLSDSTDSNGVGSWITLDDFAVRDRAPTSGSSVSHITDVDDVGEPDLKDSASILSEYASDIDLTKYQPETVEGHGVSLKGHGQNLLNISVDDVLMRGQENQFLQDGHKQLMVTGDEGDGVMLESILGTNGLETWNEQGEIMVSGEVYNVYQNSSHSVEVLIQQSLQIHLNE